ncbi:MAG: NAD(P)-binding oxidoreductase [Myxococcota bacterium]
MSHTIFLLGGNGRTGRRFLWLALEAGHTVTALVRSADRLHEVEHERLHIAVGSATDPTVLKRLLPGHDVVVSTLGPRWPTRVAAAVYPQSAAAMVAAMEATGVERLLVTSSALLFPERTLSTRLLRWIVPAIVRGAGRMEDIIRASSLNWTLVRTGFLEDGDSNAHRLSVGSLPPKPAAVSRLAVATFLLSQVEADRGHHRKVVGFCG